MSNSSSTESSSLTGKRFWNHRNGNAGFGHLLWPPDLKLPFSHKHKHTDDVTPNQISDEVYLTLKEAAARGRTSSMSSDLGVSGARRRARDPRRGRPRRRCTSEPPTSTSKYSPKPSPGVGFSSAVQSVVVKHVAPPPRSQRPRSKASSHCDVQSSRRDVPMSHRDVSPVTQLKSLSQSEWFVRVRVKLRFLFMIGFLFVLNGNLSFWDDFPSWIWRHRNVLDHFPPDFFLSRLGVFIHFSVLFEYQKVEGNNFTKVYISTGGSISPTLWHKVQIDWHTALCAKDAIQFHQQNWSQLY